MTRVRLRHLAFVTLLCTAFVGMQTNVLAGLEDPIEGFCGQWEDGPYWDCNDCDTDDANWEPDFAASGSCDFSGIEDEGDMLNTAAGYLWEAGDACWDTCDGDYAEYVAEWYETNGNPFHECYEAWQDPWNWVTWDSFDGGNGAGAFTEWSCTCQRFFFGECG
jgi:hypothetical protein